MRRIASVILCVGLLAASAVEAAQARKKEPPPPPPPPFHIDVPTRVIAVERVGTPIPARTEVGHLGGGIVCARANTVYIENTITSTTREEAVGVFATEAAAAGYRVPGGGAGDLFASSDQQKPELVIGALITRVQDGGCILADVFGDNLGRVTATIDVEWQVFDPLERKLVLRINSTGEGQVPGGNGWETAPARALREAYRSAVKAVLANPEFLAAVRAPDGAPTGRSDPTNLFPDAQSAVAPLPQIVRLPLSNQAFKDRVAETRKQVVTVLTASGSGSGFYIADGLLLTNHHVIEGTPHVKIRFLDDHEIPGEVLASDAKRDVALIKTASVGLPGLPIQPAAPDVASQVYVIGSPLGKQNEGTVTTGIVSAMRTFKDQPFIQSEINVTHGNSGGPMLDAQGNVVGMTDLGLGEFINMFIPIGDAMRALNLQFAPEATAAAKP